ncbi:MULTISPECIES: hypothetical protein [Flavobacteriaceae]|uniref:DUF4870 domain-containing protein n=2 Tax=Flavobacteriaceae TaxID=49546 RepID=A0A4Y8AWT7_9FLAO|nr:MULTISPECIES: hypothetical protein [Flavobacteriaceae]TEW76951.1 hypothetical protein E2488_03635 [Gramella jeungdoensis]GGK59081.1 hypothetical protein GCM10007963_29030 [Lutibacter litoralis]
MKNQTVNEGKTIAIIAYLWVIGLVIAFAMNNDKKNTFAAFHIRQMIGFNILSLANTFVISNYVGLWTSSLISLSLLTLWIIGLIGAAQGKEKRIPLFGDLFQNWFKGI